MNELEQWLNSGMYVFVVLSEQGYQDSEAAQEKWPYAVKYGEYRIINFHKANAKGFIDYLVENGHSISFGISTTAPMLLTWDEAKAFANQFAIGGPE